MSWYRERGVNAAFPVLFCARYVYKKQKSWFRKEKSWFLIAECRNLGEIGARSAKIMDHDFLRL